MALRFAHFAVFFLLIAGLGACAHQPIDNPNLVPAMSELEYGQLVKRHTQRTNQYSGFYQTFQADMTILTADLQTAALKQKAHFLQWDPAKFQAERDKTLQDSNAFSKFFLRFFSPESDYDDLHKGKTLWKVYLEFNGTRFEGKVRKIDDKFVEVQNMFPHFDRFSTPYEITFNVPMSTVERGKSKVILTSTIGTAEFKFPATE